MITKQYALAYVNNENNGEAIKTKEDALYVSCIKWDPNVCTNKEGACSCCYWARQNKPPTGSTCQACPLSGRRGCCNGRWWRWFSTEAEVAKATTAVFEFIKAKYREVSGKDYA